MSKYRNVLAKGHTLNWSKVVFVIKEVKNTGSLTLCTGEKIVGTFYENKLQKANQKEFRIEKK